MKTSLIALSLLTLAAPLPAASAKDAPKAATSTERVKEELLSLSRQKWLWMADKNVDQLDRLFHPQAMFVHMGGSMTKAQELNVIRTGGIHYKQADVQEASVQVMGNTAVLLNKLRLTAVVGGNEVVNPFVATEVYVKQGREWKLASLSFTRLLGN
jgi:hypothetical protein